MTESIESQKLYWDKTWKGRINFDKKTVDMNQPKMDAIIRAILTRRYYIRLKKLEIGCGTGIHANAIRSLYPFYADTWTGIDLSEAAIEMANKMGLNATVSDIYSFNPGRKFDAFIMLDVLEHIEDHQALAIKLLELANPNFRVFGNIPLYSPPGGHSFEKSMGRPELEYFLYKLGFTKFWQQIHGSYGYPYMMFEAATGNGDINREGIIALS